MIQVLRWRKSSYSGGGEGGTCAEVVPFPPA
ncbi:DUF397 domain-containing protein [Streptomyces coeruleorubidus]